jgi:two-component system, NtrC family, sensor kinase
MKKIFFLFIFSSALANISFAQDTTTQKKEYDSLREVLKKTQADTDKIKILVQLAYINSGDSTIFFSQQAIILSQKNKFLWGEARAKNLIGNYYWNINNYTGALEQYMQALKINEQIDNKKSIASVSGNLGNTYFSLGNFGKALEYSFKSLTLEHTMKLADSDGFDLSTVAKAYSQLNMPDSALYFGNLAIYYSKKGGLNFYLTLALQALGDIYAKRNDKLHALYYYNQGIPESKRIWFPLATSAMMASVAEIYYESEQKDSATYYAKQALEVAQANKAISVVVQAATLLHNNFRSTDEHESLKYLEIAAAAKDSIFNNQKNNELQNIAYNEEAKQKDKEAADIQYKSNLKLYGSIVVAAIIAILGLIQLRNNNQKKKANLLLERQKQKVEITLSELRSAQNQLIQSEKMASLGELTAGIAHEIQNPLNFVNNFSDVNTELLEEMKEEITKGNYEEVKTIADNVIDNEQKINHHGKRADSIVKGMLQHSRTSSGQKELTDINSLADEYLRLAYHGLRAKEKSFNAKIETDFDESIGKINIIPQDIGRALLNLINNAFYAVSEKLKIAGENYLPTVSVQTKKINDKIQISVADNGSGIPKNIIDKIFQPFFTTKPTGQGTGLGLSLSYDIIKAHGGELKAETKESEGTEFIISFPV